jgi:hypothetical protein
MNTDETESVATDIVSCQAGRVHRCPSQLGGNPILFAEARVLLYRNLIAALALSSDPYSSTSYGPIAALFENAFIEYATAILLALAPVIVADNVTDCLTKLRGEVIDSIVEWIEPGAASAENAAADPYLNVLPNGEWEQRLTEAHQLFSPRHPRILYSHDAENLLFLFNFVFRLRHQQHRRPFRASLESVLRGAIIELEPQMLKRFAERIHLEQIPVTQIEVAPIQVLRIGPHRRGFPADAAGHLRVLARIEPYINDLSIHLPEICRSFEGEVRLPASWQRNAFACECWKDVAEELEEGDMAVRRSVLKFIQYRIGWLKKNGDESPG